MNLQTALRLGRVSNLPTVATNAMAGMALAGAGIPVGALALVIVAGALAYIAGMFLNDAFDAEFDKISQPYRPIPAGQVSRREVFAWGYVMLGISVVLFPVAGLLSGAGWWRAALAGLVLAALILAYNRDHKENAFGPVLMGLCRVMVYVAAAFSVVALPLPILWLGAALLMLHVMGLTFVAKRESTGLIGRTWPFLCLAAPVIYGVFAALGAPWVLPFTIVLIAADLVAIQYVLAQRPQFGRAIPLLIAAIPLLDAVLIAGQGHLELALVACVGFPLTLVLQKWVRGT